MTRRRPGPRTGVTLFRLGLAALVILAGLVDLRAQRVARGRQPLAAPVRPVARPARSLPEALSAQAVRTRAGALAEASARGLSYIPGEVLVKFRNRAGRRDPQRALAAVRSQSAVDNLRWIGDVALVKDPAQPDAISLARRLAAHPDVEFAEPNYLRQVAGVSSDRWAAIGTGQAPGGAPAGVPSDPDYGELQWNLTLIGMPDAWDINPGGNSSLTVAVLDTGVTTAAETIVRRLWTGSSFEMVSLRFNASPDITSSRFTQPRDFTSNNPNEPVRDLSGHGTHVASTLAEDTNNQLALAGIAYRVRVMPIKVCLGYWDLMIVRAELGIPGFLPAVAGACSSADVAAGIRYAVDNGARVLNVSISGSSPSQVERDALVYAADRGAFVALAAGNDFENGNPVQYPAAFASSIEGVMSVGAIGKSLARAYYSSTGTYIETTAPGGSSRDGGGEDGGFIWQVTLFPLDTAPSILRPRFDRYAEVGFSGTSMAAPHAAGVAALLMSQGVSNPRAIEAFIKASARDLGPSGTDTEFGHGLIQGRAVVFGQGVWR